MATHGIASTYRSGCRCRPCTKANTARIKRQQADRAKRPASEVPHGASGYKNWGCRCDVCKAAGVEINARRTLRAHRAKASAQ